MSSIQVSVPQQLSGIVQSLLMAVLSNGKYFANLFPFESELELSSHKNFNASLLGYPQSLLIFSLGRPWLGAVWCECDMPSYCVYQRYAVKK